MYVIADGQVRWHPAIDVNRLVASITAVALAAILAKIRVEKLRVSNSHEGHAPRARQAGSIDPGWMERSGRMIRSALPARS